MVSSENKEDHTHHDIEGGWKGQGWRQGDSLGPWDSHLGERGGCPALGEGWGEIEG